jgi:hypothetical protein
MTRSPQQPSVHADAEYEVKRMTATPRYCRMCKHYKPPRGKLDESRVPLKGCILTTPQLITADSVTSKTSSIQQTSVTDVSGVSKVHPENG